MRLTESQWDSYRLPFKGMRPIHPGGVLREDSLKPLNLSAYTLAKRLTIPASRVNDIVLERRGVSADTALRFARFFGSDAQSWLNLQSIDDSRTLETSKAKAIAQEIQPLSA